MTDGAANLVGVVLVLVVLWWVIRSAVLSALRRHDRDPRGS